MDVCSFQFKIEDLDVKSGVLRGLGAAFDNVDRQQDVIRPGAFKRTLEARGSEPIPMLWSHMTSEPIGRWTEAKETAAGLAVVGELILSVPRAAETRDLMRAGVVKGLSIGYQPARDGGYRMSADGNTRELLDIDLWEISACVFPANPLAVVTSPPKAIAAMSPADWDQFFRAAGYSKRDADKLAFALRAGLKSESADEAAVADALNFLRSRRKGI